MISFSFIILLISVISVYSLTFIEETIRPLNQYPMIMSHDAATGEIIPERDHILEKWTITQFGGLTKQLDCGSRSFDYRPYYHNSTLYAHHGGVKIHKPMSESIIEVKEWVHNNPDDLVMFYLSHFEGDAGCQAASINLLETLNVYTITDCSILSTLTVQQTKLLSKQLGGGYLFALVDCMDEFYDSSITCYGHGYSCYDSWPQNSSSIPWNKLSTYMSLVTSSTPSEEAELWMAQAHWQSSALSISIGTLHNSTILLDEEKSGVNQWIANEIKQNSFSYLNILELDNVCDGGFDVYNALKEYI